jgi:hypothetical protein
MKELKEELQTLRLRLDDQAKALEDLMVELARLKAAQLRR